MSDFLLLLRCFAKFKGEHIAKVIDFSSHECTHGIREHTDVSVCISKDALDLYQHACTLYIYNFKPEFAG